MKIRPDIGAAIRLRVAPWSIPRGSPQHALHRCAAGDRIAPCGSWPVRMQTTSPMIAGF